MKEAEAGFIVLVTGVEQHQGLHAQKLLSGDLQPCELLRDHLHGQAQLVYRSHPQVVTDRRKEQKRSQEDFC